MNSIANDPTKYSDGGRIYLRQLTEHDVTDTYISWFKDPVVTEYLDAKNLSKTEVTSYISGGHASGLHVMYGIFDEKNDRHIGNCKIGPITWKHGRAGLVTFLGERSYWNKGIAREAIAIGTRLAFQKFGLRKLSDGVVDGNIGSVKAYTAAGWVVEARIKGHHLIDENPRDRIIISCFNPAFFPKEG